MSNMGFGGDFLQYFGVIWGHLGLISGSVGVTISHFCMFAASTVDWYMSTWGSEVTFWGTLGSLGVTLESFLAVLVSQQVIFLCSPQVRLTRLVFCCNVVLYMWRFIYHTAVFVFFFLYVRNMSV